MWKKAQWGFPCQGQQLIRGPEARSLIGLAGRDAELRSSACGRPLRPVKGLAHWDTWDMVVSCQDCPFSGM